MTTPKSRQKCNGNRTLEEPRNSMSLIDCFCYRVPPTRVCGFVSVRSDGGFEAVGMAAIGSRMACR